MQKITTFLWFNDQAEEAANFYCSIFKNSKITSSMKANGKVMSATFNLDGQEFIALNGGPLFKFTEAISLFVSCETQGEIDEMWTKLLSGGGQESMCGWLKDKYGLSWQIVPPALGQMLSDKDATKAKRTMDAMMKMRKLDIAALKKAYHG
ncbi:MAG TPA: VOC family protein [Cyclobacteriaceae bacterium]|jgi:predicted 3-demethylubiquinone-9 3-methyltransferase (glyoxalase superfamily)|nr:VOC family protein [Cyclobacteriaceae bacterium]